jgi:hypothetical protein
VPETPNCTPEEWYETVATAAYFRAERRGSNSGSAEEDWLAAEAELKQGMQAH